MNLFFASSDTAPLAAETIFQAGPLAVTNSIFYGLVVAAAVLALFLVAAAGSGLWPKSRLAFSLELMLDTITGLLSDVFGDRTKAVKHMPMLLSLFVFILACNLSGLIPGVGSLTVSHDGSAVPLLRPFTTDLNATLALAIFSLTAVQVYAIKELGLIGHIRHYFNNNPKKPLNLFIGINELFGELLRLVTLSLRLFGVIYGGEALLHAIYELAGVFGPIANLPIMFLEIFFSLVQAYLFMMLTATYLAMATSHIEEGPSENKELAATGSVSAS